MQSLYDVVALLDPKSLYLALGGDQGVPALFETMSTMARVGYWITRPPRDSREPSGPEQRAKVDSKDRPNPTIWDDKK